MKHFLIAITIVSILCFSPTWAGPSDDANASAAYKIGDYATVLKIVRPLAEQGNAKAQSNLGLMYQQGKGITRDSSQAVKWYRLAAEQGFSTAQYNLGNMYHTGDGVVQNYAEASKWYRLAAAQGNAAAQSKIASNSVNSNLLSYIERYNKRLPSMVAPTLRQELTSAAKNEITFSYTEITKTALELAPLNLAITQRPYIFPSICQASDTGRMLSEGISFKYLYYGKDGKLAAQLIFQPNDCRSAH